MSHHDRLAQANLNQASGMHLDQHAARVAVAQVHAVLDLAAAVREVAAVLSDLIPQRPADADQ